MIVAAHQPNFLPWLGFFDRMRQADLFVLVDHVQFERQNYQNRTLIKADTGPRWVTVPVEQASQGERIVDKKICRQRGGKYDWSRKTLLSLRQSYARAPHFKDYEKSLEAIFTSPWERLVDMNIALLDFARAALEIKTPVYRSSELGISGQKSDMVLNLCRAVGAKTYIAGLGGSKGYLDEAAFKAAGIAVSWQKFEHPVYPQEPSSAPFARGLSVVDLLVNCGPSSAKVVSGGAA
jgi:hypothetical protein